MTSKIEWTGETWNPIVGCSPKSEGCANCYAAPMAFRLEAMARKEILKTGASKLIHYGGTTIKADRKGATPVFSGRVHFSEDALLKPLRWKKPRLIFVNSMSDLFHENVPDGWIDRVFAVMALCPQHTFQVLTKRADRMREYFADPNTWGRIVAASDDLKPSGLWNGNAYQLRYEITTNGHLPNVWLGVSVENQAAADERIPDLLATPAAVRWISAEPLIEPVDLTRWLHDEGCPAQSTFCICSEPREVHLNWVVCGGESGAKARPMHPDWARSLRDQCAAADVPFLFKQWGEWGPAGCVEHEGIEDVNRGITKWAYGHFDEQGRFGLSAVARSRNGHVDEAYGLIGSGTPQTTLWRVGKKAAGRHLDGVLHDEYPAGYTREAKL